jgi:hypothetical protein
VVEIHAVVMVVETAVVEKTVVVETEEDNILFYNYKKGQFKCPLVNFGYFYVYNGHFVIYNLMLPTNWQPISPSCFINGSTF